MGDYYLTAGANLGSVQGIFQKKIPLDSFNSLTIGLYGKYEIIECDSPVEESDLCIDDSILVDYRDYASFGGRTAFMLYDKKKSNLFIFGRVEAGYAPVLESPVFRIGFSVGGY